MSKNQSQWQTAFIDNVLNETLEIPQQRPANYRVSSRSYAEYLSMEDTVLKFRALEVSADEIKQILMLAQKKQQTRPSQTAEIFKTLLGRYVQDWPRTPDEKAAFLRQEAPAQNALQACDLRSVRDNFEQKKEQNKTETSA